MFLLKLNLVILLLWALLGNLLCGAPFIYGPLQIFHHSYNKVPCVVNQPFLLVLSARF